MADKLVTTQTSEGPVTERYVDMGDGTWAKVVSADLGEGGGGGGLTNTELRATPLPVSTDGADAGLVALRDALRGTGNKTHADIITAIAAVAAALIDGTVRVGGNVEVVNDAGNPLPVSGTVSATISDGSGPVTVDGTVAVTDGGGSLTVDGTVGVSGNVEVVNDVGNPLPVSGTVTSNAGTPKTYTAPACGELAGSASALQMPSVACSLIRFKAEAANAGKVYIGVAGVTAVNGTTDTTTGFQLAAGDDTGWIPVDNANRFYRICDNAGDDLTYMALA